MRLLGEILVKDCGLPEETIGDALKIQEEGGGRIGEVLISKKAVSESDI